MSDDAKTERERQFSKIEREIVVATREQGNDPAQNFRLRLALTRADEANMPDDMVVRARQQGTGELPSPDYEEKMFEGYGASGVAVLVKAITADPSRTAAELEELFEAHGGNLGDEGCVAWQFQRRGLVEVPASHVDDPDEFLMEVIEMGGEELTEPLPGSGNDERAPAYGVYCDPNDLGALDAAVRETYPVRSAAIVYEPTQQVPVEPAVARKFLGLFEKLLAREDVQAAYANWTFA